MFDEKKACFPEEWRKIKVDESMLLRDILDSGVYGYESRERMHSSNLTLNEVDRQWHKKRGFTVLRTIFPPVKSMKREFFENSSISVADCVDSSYTEIWEGGMRI